MLKGYDYITLAPKEFELLCRDVVQRKVSIEIGKAVTFNSYSEGKDNGKDAMYEDREYRIVLQAKRYSGFDNLYNQIKNFELKKIKKTNAQRYILCVAKTLSEFEYNKLFELLKPYLNSSSDIVHGAVLDNLLAQSAYSDIVFEYPKLYLPSMQVLERLLNAAVYGQSKDKLEEFRSISKYYVQDESFSESFKLLNQNNYLVISGEAGVGKSTLAGMLSLFLIEKGYEFIFVRSSIAEASEPIWNTDKKQLFFFDDYLGSVAFDKFDRNEDRALTDFLKKISKAKNKLFILTTREYVFKQAIVEYPELSIFDGVKYNITQKSFTDTFKIKILYNYLYYSEIELKHIYPFIGYNNPYNDIIFHKNFTPRIINDYIDKYYNKNDHSYSLYQGLYNYLKDPFEFWKKIFLKINVGSQTVLLIMAISGEPVLVDELYKTYVNIGAYRKLFETGFEKESFEEALHELSGSFISISVNVNKEILDNDGDISLRDYTLIFTHYRASRFIEFSNPSIKDFSLKLLSERDDFIEHIIKGASSFNQLFDEFTFNEEVPSDKLGQEKRKRIFIPYRLQGIFIQRVIAEFDKLPVCRVNKISWSRGDDTFHFDENLFDNRLLKLNLIIAAIDIERYEQIRSFVVDMYLTIVQKDQDFDAEISNEENSFKRLSLSERLEQVPLITKLYKMFTFDIDKTISQFYNNIKFAKEFISFYKLRDLFKDQWDEFYHSNKKIIRENIKITVYDDVDYFLWEGIYDSEERLYQLVEEDMYDLEDFYQFRFSKKLKRDLNDMSGRNLFDLDRNDDIIEEDELSRNNEVLGSDMIVKKRNEYVDFVDYKQALHSLKPEWDDFVDRYEAYDYIKNSIDDLSLAKKLIGKISKSKSGYYYSFLRNVPGVNLLLRHLIDKKTPKGHFSLFQDIICSPNIPHHVKTVLPMIAYQLNIQNLFEFRKTTLISQIEPLYDQQNMNFDCIETIDLLINQGLIYQQDIWCSFVSISFHTYLTSWYIVNLPIEERENTYNDFRDNFFDIDYDNIRQIWAICNELDYKTFSKCFTTPVVSDEYNKIKDMNNSVVNFMKELDFSCEYSYCDAEKSFMIDGSSGGNSLLEDICAELNIGVTYITFELEDFFNISYNKNRQLVRYLRQNCMTNKKNYRMNFKKLMMDNEFIELLFKSGLSQIFEKYVEGLNSFLKKIDFKDN